MTQQKTAEQIRQQYIKTNKENRPKLLKKYGIKKIDDITRVVGMTGTVGCNMTELARVLLNHPALNMKVSFQKQMKEKDVLFELMQTYRNSAPADVESQFKKTLKTVLNGQERLCEGFHNSKLDSFGRLYFTDNLTFWDKTKSFDTRMILLSLNHLNWVEVNKVKYILK